MWYHGGMCTTCNSEETPRPEPRCPRCGNSEDAPNSHDLCENCVEAMEDRICVACGDGILTNEGFCNICGTCDGDPVEDLPTGYEADDERPYGWDVPEDEYPDW